MKDGRCYLVTSPRRKNKIPLYAEGGGGAAWEEVDWLPAAPALAGEAEAAVRPRPLPCLARPVRREGGGGGAAAGSSRHTTSPRARPSRRRPAAHERPQAGQRRAFRALPAAYRAARCGIPQAGLLLPSCVRFAVRPSRPPASAVRRHLSPSLPFFFFFFSASSALTLSSAPQHTRWRLPAATSVPGTAQSTTGNEVPLIFSAEGFKEQ